MGKRFATTMPGSRRRTGGRCSKDPEALAADIRAHLERENAYAAAALDDTEALRERLVAEMRGRIKEDDSTVPEPDGPVRLFHPLPRGRAAPAGLPRSRAEGGPETILLDGDKEARGPTRSSISAARTIPPTIACSPGAPTSRARSTSRSAFATSRPARTCPRRGPGDVRRRRSGLGDSSGLLLRRARRESPPRAGQAPSARHAGRGRRADLRGGRIPASS